MFEKDINGSLNEEILKKYCEKNSESNIDPFYFFQIQKKFLINEKDLRNRYFKICTSFFKTDLTVVALANKFYKLLLDPVQRFYCFIENGEDSADSGAINEVVYALNEELQAINSKEKINEYIKKLNDFIEKIIFEIAGLLDEKDESSIKKAISLKNNLVYYKKFLSVAYDLKTSAT